jgi:hypothetical protein
MGPLLSERLLGFLGLRYWFARLEFALDDQSPKAVIQQVALWLQKS